mgnify:CR=1 FL=1
MCIRTIEELQEDTREKQIIDIRDRADFDKETYPGAINIYWEEFEEHMDEIRKDCPVYLICYTGQKSDEIAEELTEQGYEIYSIKNGYRAWLRIKLSKLMSDHDEAEQRTRDIERSIIKKFRKPIWRRFTKAIREYELVKDGDKIAVCISGGKDSMLMAKLFQELSRHGKKNFEVVFLVMNPGYNEINYQTIRDNARILNVPITVFESDIFNIVASEEQSPCYLCARMRRGYLYSKAKELGCNKIALGHHYDDVIETILMGMLYGAQVQTMMPKLHSIHFEGMELIRPLYLIREEDIKHWRDYNSLHFIQCACRFTDTCTTCRPNGESASKRMEIKHMIAEMKKVNPYVETNIFRSIENVNLDTVVAYKKNGVRHSFLEDYESCYISFREQSFFMEKRQWNAWQMRELQFSDWAVSAVIQQKHWHEAESVLLI